MKTFSKESIDLRKNLDKRELEQVKGQRNGKRQGIKKKRRKRKEPKKLRGKLGKKINRNQIKK